MSTAQQKAAETRHRKAVERIWSEVQHYREIHPECKCKLRKGMTYADLRELRPGCTGHNARYICPVLAKYRRLVPQPEYDDEPELGDV